MNPGMSELSFLIDLLLNHKLPPAVKKLISERIKEVETLLSMKSAYIPRTAPQSNHGAVTITQAPSTLALMAKHGDIPEITVPAVNEPLPVMEVAQTAATQQALIERNKAILAAAKGQNIMTEKGKMERTSPRKW